MAFDLINCLVDSTNTGFSRCVPRPGKLEYDIAIPKGTRITLADSADPQGFFEALFTENDPVQRGYLLGKWIKVDDNSADDVTESFDAGVETTLYDGAYKWMRRVLEGALCQHKSLRRFNGSQDKFDWLMVFRSTTPDARFYIVGKRVYNSSTQQYELAGVQYDDVFTPKWQAATGNTSALYRFKTVMGDVSQINEDMMFIPVPFDVGELPRIQDVNITASKSSTGVFDVLATMSCGGESVTDAYPVLADDGAWVVLNNAGSAVAATGVTIVNGKFRIALDTSDVAYIAGTSFKFKLASISTLAAAPYNVEWVESRYTSLISK